MADRKSGPVKPPVLDLKARPPGRRGPERRGPERPGAAPAPEPAASAPTLPLRAPARTPNVLFETPAPAASLETVTAEPVVAPISEPEPVVAETVTAAPEPTPAAKEDSVEPPEPTRAEEPVFEAPRATTPPPPAPPRQGRFWGPALTGAILGALLGTALTTALLYSDVLPQPVATVTPASTSAAAVDLTPIEQRLAALEARPEPQATTTTATGTTTTAAAVDTSAFDALNQRIAGLEQALSERNAQVDAALAELRNAPQVATTTQAAATAPAPEAVDLSPLQQQLASLTQQVDALRSQPAPTFDTSALEARIAGFADELAGVQRNVTALQTAIQTAETNGTQTQQQLVALRSSVEAAQSQLQGTQTTVAALTQSAQDAGDTAALQLPLAISGLEAAFSSGRPFGPELRSLSILAPDTTPPQSIAEAASTGLVAPETLHQRFSAAVPAMLAAQGDQAGANWTDATVDWFKALLVLRPTGEVQGDTVEAILTQIDAALGRADFATARDLFAKLPPAVVAAAGDLPAAVAAQADAQSFVAQLRTTQPAAQQPVAEATP